MTVTDLILGIDPGATGALAWIHPDGRLHHVADTPSAGGIVTGSLLADMIRERPPTVAWVEQVHAMPSQGVTSMFKFGRSYGTTTGVLEALGIPANYVTPAAWKGSARLTTPKGTTSSARKALARRRALELWPEHADMFARVKDSDRAEAALIALHGAHERGTARR